MHRQFGHPSSTVLVQILRAVPSTFRHADIFDVMPVKTTNPNINLPKWRFQKTTFSVGLNILDLGTPFQLLRQGRGSPSSRECLDSFVSLWVGWAGWPQTLSCDRGVHNRGVFARTLAQHGVLIRQAGEESPEQIGRVERHGGLFKAVLKRMITEHAVRSFDDIKIAIAEAVSTKNNLSRNGGFSP